MRRASCGACTTLRVGDNLLVQAFPRDYRLPTLPRCLDAVRVRRATEGLARIDASEPRVVAVLDWELATLGHPLADLAYNCMTYHLPAGHAVSAGCVGADATALGLPTQDQYVDTYARWRISDPLLFFQRLQNERGAQTRLDDILDGDRWLDAQIQVVGVRPASLAEVHETASMILSHHLDIRTVTLGVNLKDCVDRNLDWLIKQAQARIVEKGQLPVPE
mgnify:CR=1 FL=1